jgi:predicted secreted protein
MWHVIFNGPLPLSVRSYQHEPNVRLINVGPSYKSPKLKLKQRVIKTHVMYRNVTSADYYTIRTELL